MATIYIPNENGWQESHGYPFYARVKVDQSYNSASNKSTLTITLQYKGSTGLKDISNNSYVKFDGSELTPSIAGTTFQVNYSDTWTATASSWSKTVTHGSDGSASVPIALYLGIYNGTYTWTQTATLSLSGTPSYTLSISQGTGSSVSVLRGSTALTNGAQVYRGESLTINFTVSTGYALGTHTVNGTTRASGYSHTVDGSVSVVATATVLSYTLSISPATGSSISVSRQSSPKQGAATGTLANGATVYYSDTLKISAAASTGYDLGTLKVNGSTFTNGGIHTVAGAVSVTTTASPSTSTVAASNGNFGQAVAITVTRRSSSYTHTVTTSCLGQTETLVNKGTTTSISWTPALATYAPLIPNAMSASATITCTTYNGNTAVGTHSVTITLSLRAQDVKPVVSIGVSDPMGYATTYGGYVAKKSKIRVALTNTLKYGATLKTLSITANGESFSYSPATTGAITSTANTSVTAAISDSRGQSSGTQSTTITILAYNPPKINGFSVHRSDSSGTADDAGAYMRVDYNVTVTALNNHNGKTLAVKYKKRDVSTWSTQSIAMSAYTANGSVVIAADTESTYDVQLSITDDFQETSRTTQLSSAHVYPMNFQAGGKGVAFGKVSEIKKSVEIADDWTLYHGLKPIRDTLNLGEADAYIPQNGDYNDYVSPGVFSVRTNVIAGSLAHRPSDVAGTLRVWNATGSSAVPGSTWYYVIQEYTNLNGVTWRRSGGTGSGTTVVWNDWERFGANDSDTGYCKMPDGTLMCWGNKSYSFAGKTASQSAGSKFWYIEFAEDVAFPEAFYAKPVLTITKTEGSVTAPVGWVSYTASKITEVDFTFPAEPNLSGSNNATVGWLAIGRWKA